MHITGMSLGWLLMPGNDIFASQGWQYASLLFQEKKSVSSPLASDDGKWMNTDQFTFGLEGGMGLEEIAGLDGRVVLRFFMGATLNMSSSSSSSPNNGSTSKIFL